MMREQQGNKESYCNYLLGKKASKGTSVDSLADKLSYSVYCIIMQAKARKIVYLHGLSS